MFDYVKPESGIGVFNSHICNIYQNEDERLSILSSFVLSGIENNEKCLIIIRNDQKSQILKELQKYIEIDNYLHSQQVEILSVEDFFLEGGSFSPYRVIIKLKEKTNNLRSQDLFKLRIVADLTWTITNNRSFPNFLDFERYITEFCVEDSCIFLDQYDKNKIDFSMLTDIFMLHPIAIIGTEIFNKSIGISNKNKVVTKAIHKPETLMDLKTILNILDFKRAKNLHIWNAFSHSEKPTLVLGENGTIINYNASMERLSGYRKEEIKDLKSWVSKLIPELKNRQIILNLVENSEKMKEIKVEVELQLRDNERRWVEFTVHEIYQSDYPATLSILQGIDITSRKKKEEQLLFHAQLLESVQESIVAINLNKKILYWGKGAEGLYGYQSKEVLGAPITIIFPQQEKEKELQRIKKAIETRSWKGQAKQIRKDGTEFWAGSRLSLVKDQNGYPCGFLRIDVDISGYKSTERELKLSEQKLRNLFNSSPFGMLEYHLKEDGRLLLLGANPAADSILGVDTDQFIGKTIEEAFPPLSQTEIPEKYRMVAQTGEEWRLDQITYEDSQIKGIYEVVAFQTEPMRMVASFYDKTASELAKRKLEESEKKYQSLVVNIPGVTWISNSDGHTTFISENVHEVYGYSSEEIYKSGEDLWFSRIHPDDVERVKSNFQKIFENNESFDIEYRIKRRDNEYIWLHDRGLMVYEEGKKKFAYGVFFDISEHKQAKNLLKSSEEKFRNLFNNANDALYLFEISSSGELGGFIEVNDIACKRLEYTREEFLEMTPLEIKTREEGIKLYKKVNNLLSQGEKPFETVHQSKSGKKIP
ncbi:MAG: PAS domain S-box protein, partial [Candidatus Hodarchaeales archaeon]